MWALLINGVFTGFWVIRRHHQTISKNARNVTLEIRPGDCGRRNVNVFCKKNNELYVGRPFGNPHGAFHLREHTLVFL